MTVLDCIGTVLIYFAISVGLAWPVAMRIAAVPTERLLATVSLSLVGVYIVGWAVYVWALPLLALWTLPFISAIVLSMHWRTIAATWRDRDARALIGSQGIVTAWCV